MKKIAVLLAAEQYNKFGETPYCINDMNELRDTLVNYCAFEPDNVISQALYTDIKVGPKDILNLIKRKLDSCDEGDMFLFFYAGHGHYDENQNMSYLILPATTDDFENTAIKLSDVCNLLKKKQMVSIRIFDTCHSGYDARNLIKRNLNHKKFGRDILLDVGKEEGWITFASCKEDEESFADPDLEHGIFTYYFTEAIKNFNLGQYIYPELLKVKVCEMVKEHCDKRKLQQTPTFNTSISGNVVLAESKNYTSSNNIRKANNRKKDSKCLTQTKYFEEYDEYMKRVSPYLNNFRAAGITELDGSNYFRDEKIFFINIEWDDWFYEFVSETLNSQRRYFIEVSYQEAKEIWQKNKKHHIKVKLSKNNVGIIIDELILDVNGQHYKIYGIVTYEHCNKIKLNNNYNNYFEPVIEKNEIYFLDDDIYLSTVSILNNEVVRTSKLHFVNMEYINIFKNYIVYVKDNLNVYNYKTSSIIKFDSKYGENSIDQILFSNDGKQICILFNNIIEVWDLENKKQINTIRPNCDWKRKWYKKFFKKNKMKNLRYNNDDSIIAGIIDRNAIIFIDSKTTNLKHKLKLREKIILFEFLPNSDFIIILTEYGIEIWNYAKNELHKEIKKSTYYDEHINNIKVNYLKNIFMLVDDSKDKTIINIYNYNLFLLNSLEFNKNSSSYFDSTTIIKRITYANFSHDNKYIVTCCDNNEFCFFRWG